jgi:hypothetical protein
LPVLGPVMHTPGFGRSFIQSGRLKENSLLGSPEKDRKGK